MDGVALISFAGGLLREISSDGMVDDINVSNVAVLNEMKRDMYR